VKAKVPVNHICSCCKKEELHVTKGGAVCCPGCDGMKLWPTKKW
jgi:hypothetical protein